MGKAWQNSKLLRLAVIVVPVALAAVWLLRFFAYRLAERLTYSGQELRYSGFVEAYFIPYFVTTRHEWPRDLTEVAAYARACARSPGAPGSSDDTRATMAADALAMDPKIEPMLGLTRQTDTEMVWCVVFREPSGRVASGPTYDTLKLHSPTGEAAKDRTGR